MDHAAPNFTRQFYPVGSIGMARYVAMYDARFRELAQTLSDPTNGWIRPEHGSAGADPSSEQIHTRDLLPLIYAFDCADWNAVTLALSEWGLHVC